MKISNETKVGILAVMAIAVLVWGYWFLKGRNLLSRDTTVYVEFANVSQLTESSPVLVNGYQVGVVKTMEIKPDDVKKIIVALNIKRGIKIPKTAIADLVSAGIMGGKMIELRFDKPCTDGTCAVNGDYLTGTVQSTLGSIMKPEELDLYMNKVKTGLTGVATDLGFDMSDANAKNSLSNSAKDIPVILENLKQTTALLNKIMRSSAGTLDATLKSVNASTSNLAANNTKINGIIGNTEAFSANLKTVDLGKTTNSANQAMAELQNTLKSTEKAVADLNQIVANLKNGQGTMGQLLANDSLYHNLNRTLTQVNLVAQDLRLNPKRYTGIFKRKAKDYVAPNQDPAQKVEVPMIKH